MDVIERPVLLPHQHLACRRVDAIPCNSADLPKHGNASTIDLNLLSVQPQPVLGEGLTRSNRCDGMKILLQSMITMMTKGVPRPSNR